MKPITIIVAMFALVALMGIASAHAEDESGETEVNATVEAILKIDTPGSIELGNLTVPANVTVVSSTITGAIQATDDWVLKVKEDSTPADGKMQSGSNSLTKKMKVDIQGDKTGTTTLTGDEKTLTSGHAGSFDCAFSYQQETVWGDYSGAYSILVSYYIYIQP